MSTLKQKLADAFSDDKKKVSWQQWVEPGVMFCLILNALEIYLSTYDSLVQQYGAWFTAIDIFTTIVFFIEVSLRIWVADLQDDKFRGFIGRIRYCLTPYGLIDVLSVYPSVLCLFTPFSPVIFKSIRVLRLLRIFRFMKAFRLLGNAVANKKQEIFLSFGFLAVITFMLSLVLFFVEHNANPERYTNGMDSIVWAFMQYIGDPGGFGDNPPETFSGRIISCIIGILGIAVFAVPAGLLGSGFVEEMENTKKEKNNKDNVASILLAFQRKRCRHTDFYTVPIYCSVPQLQVITRLSVEEILDAIDSTNDLRLANLAQCKSVEDEGVDQLVVEHFVVNRPYGCCINRNSKVTIVETSAFVEVGMGNFAFYLAMMGGFNYISRETGAVRPYQSYYTIEDESSVPNLPDFIADLNNMANAEDHFVFYVLAASGSMEPKLPTQIHFNYGGEKGDETYNNPNRTLHRTEKFEAFFQGVSKDLKQFLDFETDKQRYYDTSDSDNIMRKLKNADKVNSITLRIKWPFVCCDLRRYVLAKVLSDNMYRRFVSDEKKTYPSVLEDSGIGFEGYDISSCETNAHAKS